MLDRIEGKKENMDVVYDGKEKKKENMEVR